MNKSKKQYFIHFDWKMLNVFSKERGFNKKEFSLTTTSKMTKSKLKIYLDFIYTLKISKINTLNTSKAKKVYITLKKK